MKIRNTRIFLTQGVFTMVKSYLHSFISMKYIWILPSLSFIIFILAFCFFRTHIMAFRTAALAVAVVLIIFMVRFYAERASISRNLKKLDRWQEYNDSYIIGQAFLLEDRMLVYDRKMIELHYKDMTEIKGGPYKGERYKLTFVTPSIQCMDITSSKGQAERFTAMLLKRNQNIKVSGIEPDGDGIIAHVESGKDAPKI